MRDRALPGEQRPNGQLPTLTELTREALGGMVAAQEHTLPVGWDEADQSDARRRDRLDDEGRGFGRKPTQPALLPRRDEAADAFVVLDSRTRGGERETAARALAAAAHGPGGWSAATLAERETQQRQALAATVAELLPD